MSKIRKRKTEGGISRHGKRKRKTHWKGIPTGPQRRGWNERIGEIRCVPNRGDYDQGGQHNKHNKEFKSGTKETPQRKCGVERGAKKTRGGGRDSNDHHPLDGGRGKTAPPPKRTKTETDIKNV